MQNVSRKCILEQFMKTKMIIMSDFFKSKVYVCILNQFGLTLTWRQQNINSYCSLTLYTYLESGSISQFHTTLLRVESRNTDFPSVSCVPC